MNEPDYLHVMPWDFKKRPIGRKQLGKARHGTRWAYNEGCGCEDCTRAERLYSRERKRRLAASSVPQDEHRTIDA